MDTPEGGYDSNEELSDDYSDLDQGDDQEEDDDEEDDDDEDGDQDAEDDEDEDAKEDTETRYDDSFTLPRYVANSCFMDSLFVCVFLFHTMPSKDC